MLRILFLVAEIATLSLLLGEGRAEPHYPMHVVRIILPFSPGGATDAALRMLSERLAEHWTQPVIVENRPGASSIIGTDAVAKASPDGYTLLATVTLLAQNYSLRSDLPYDTFHDLVPVTQLQREQLLLYVRGNSPVRSLEDLLAVATARPNELNVGTWGIGSPAHLIVETICHDKNIQMTPVPYKGAPDITNAVLGGSIEVGIGDVLSNISSFQTGILRPIAITGPARLTELPTVKTLQESGIEGFEAYNWFGLFAPSATPPEAIQIISNAINDVERDPPYAKRLRQELLANPSITTPEQFRDIFKQDVGRWGSIIRETGVRLP